MESPEFVRLAGVAIVTAIVVITAAVVIGFAVLFRRGRRGLTGGSGGSSPSLETRAGSLLLQLDELVRDTDDELGFAMAQFGTERAKPLRDAVASARSKLTEGFRLRQLLDDANPESDTRRREWTLQVIALAEQGRRELEAETAAYRELRRREVRAADDLARLRDAIAAARGRVETARATLEGLRADYADERSAGVAGNADAAADRLDEAERIAAEVAPRIRDSGVSDVSDELRAAGQHVHRANQLLDEVERAASDLAAARTAPAELVTETRGELEAAKVAREAAPDAETGEAIIVAMREVDAALAASERDTRDPVAGLDRIGDAAAKLDLALAGARNQQQRLEHARAALVGTLLSARSQIAEVHTYLQAHGGGVGARTRLAEAERQLMLAEAETDPVEALDTARRAVTHARDADALARYDAM